VQYFKNPSSKDEKIKSKFTFNHSLNETMHNSIGLGYNLLESKDHEEFAQYNLLFSSVFNIPKTDFTSLGFNIDYDISNNKLNAFDQAV